MDYKKLKKAELVEILKNMQEGKVSTTVIEEDRPAASRLHPTMKPIKLIARLMKNSSRPGEIVLDTFGGSGSTLMAAEQLGRKCFMAEIDPKYCDVIIKRWEDFTGREAKLIERRDDGQYK